MLSELIRGLLDDGYRLTVISRTCKVRAHDRLRWIHVPGPGRPFPLAYPWFFIVGSLITWRKRSGPVLSTGAIVANHVDWTAVHFCHHATDTHGTVAGLASHALVSPQRLAIEPTEGSRRALLLQPEADGGPDRRLARGVGRGRRALPWRSHRDDPERRQPRAVPSGRAQARRRSVSAMAWRPTSSWRCSSAANGSARDCRSQSTRWRTHPTGSCSSSETETSRPTELTRRRRRRVARRVRGDRQRPRALLLRQRRVRSAHLIRDVFARHV